jgi:hypothetical protein
MITVLTTAGVVLYITTCWYSLKRQDQKLRAQSMHPCRKTRKK